MKRFWGFESGGKAYDGVDITIVGDPRDITKDRFSLEAHKKKPGNAFVLTKPKMPGCLWMEPDKKQFDKKENVKAFVQGDTVAVNAYKKLSAAEMGRKLLLQFPADLELSDKPFLEGTDVHDDLEIPMKVLTTRSKTGLTERLKDHSATVADGAEVPKTDVPIKNLFGRVSWRLCNMKSERGIAITKKKKSKGMDLMQGQIGGSSEEDGMDDDDEDLDY